jgi:hypothetical protein
MPPALDDIPLMIMASMGSIQMETSMSLTGGGMALLGVNLRDTATNPCCLCVFLEIIMTS